MACGIRVRARPYAQIAQGVSNAARGVTLDSTNSAWGERAASDCAAGELLRADCRLPPTRDAVRRDATRHRALETAGAVGQRNAAFRVPECCEGAIRPLAEDRSARDASRSLISLIAERISQPQSYLRIRVAHNAESRWCNRLQEPTCARVPSRRIDSVTGYLIWLIAACVTHRSAALEFWVMHCTLYSSCPWELNVSRSDSEKYRWV